MTQQTQCAIWNVLLRAVLCNLEELPEERFSSWTCPISEKIPSAPDDRQQLQWLHLHVRLSQLGSSRTREHGISPGQYCLQFVLDIWKMTALTWKHKRKQLDDRDLFSHGTRRSPLKCIEDDICWFPTTFFPLGSDNIDFKNFLESIIPANHGFVFNRLQDIELDKESFYCHCHIPETGSSLQLHSCCFCCTEFLWLIGIVPFSQKTLFNSPLFILYVFPRENQQIKSDSSSWRVNGLCTYNY